MSDSAETTRVAITWSKGTDLTLRSFLGSQGLKKGVLSKFIDEAVRWRVFLVLAVVIASASFMGGCGGTGKSTNPPTGPVLQGNTQVVLLVSSTANDLWSSFTLNISSISLVNEAGNQVTLFASPLYYIEFIHFNAALQPLTTVSIPQDVYTAAVVTYSGPDITCSTVNATGGLVLSDYDIEPFGPYSASINFPSPITITGTAMALSLDLLVSQSTSFSACTIPASGTLPPSYSITPTFTLSPVVLSPEPMNDSNGKEGGIEGMVFSVDAAGDTFSLQTANGSVISDGTGPPLTFSTGAGTIFQGIGGLPELLAGMFVDMDAAIQADGSLLATRIAVQDTTATNMMMGPLVSVFGADSAIQDQGLQQQGINLSTQPVNAMYYSFDTGTAFKTSGEFSSLQNLPFTAAFNASSMAAGQNVAIFSGAIPTTGPSYPRASTIALMPQTLNGTVNMISSSGGYQVYTVGLAPYDPIPTLTAVAGQSTNLTSPNSVQVYVDASTQLLNSSPLSLGSVARFRGLLFNDSGTLRLICSQVNDGVVG